MEMRLFGPVGLKVDGIQVKVGGQANQLFLAILASVGGHHVTVDSLIRKFWPEESTPIDPRQRLAQIVAELRRALRRLEVDASQVLPDYRQGYRLLIDRSSVDLHRFTDLCREAASRGRRTRRRRPWRLDWAEPAGEGRAVAERLELAISHTVRPEPRSGSSES